MSTATTFSTTIQQIILKPSQGVVGLVDDLLAACSEYSIELTWQGGHCRLSSSADEWEETIDLPIRKSVFRATLARLATLCNMQQPDSVSPYGGTADLAVGQSPKRIMRVTLVNTSAEQKLRLQPREPRISTSDVSGNSQGRPKVP
jgi:hypothetical protein